VCRVCSSPPSDTRGGGVLCKGGAPTSQNLSQNRRGNGYPMVSDDDRDTVSDKPNWISRDVGEQGFLFLQGGGRRFEACSAHANPQVRASPSLTGRVIAATRGASGWVDRRLRPAERRRSEAAPPLRDVSSAGPQDRWTPFTCQHEFDRLTHLVGLHTRAYAERLVEHSQDAHDHRHQQGDAS
jgi:hypothetical protein